MLCSSSVLYEIEEGVGFTFADVLFDPTKELPGDVIRGSDPIIQIHGHV